MTEKLKISKGSASVNIRILEDWNAVKKVLVQGSRKDHYTAESDLMKVILQRLEQGFTRRLGYADEKLRLIESMAESHANGDRKLKGFYQTRLRQIRDVRDLLDGALKVLPKFRSAGKMKMLKFLFQ